MHAVRIQQLPYQSHERSFSALQMVKNLLRTSMDDKSLLNLLILEVENETANKIMEKWSKLKNRKITM